MRRAPPKRVIVRFNGTTVCRNVAAPPGSSSPGALPPVQLRTSSIAACSSGHGSTDGSGCGRFGPKVTSNGTLTLNSHSEIDALPHTWYGTGPVIEASRWTLASTVSPRRNATSPSRSARYESGNCCTRQSKLTIPRRLKPAAAAYSSARTPNCSVFGVIKYAWHVSFGLSPVPASRRRSSVGNPSGGSKCGFNPPSDDDGRRGGPRRARAMSS